MSIAFGLELHHDRHAGGRRRREVETDLRLHGLRRRARHHVQLHHQVAALLERPGGVGRLHHLAPCPATSRRRPPPGPSGIAAKARFAIGAIELASGAANVEADVRVMQRLIVAGTELDAADVAVAPFGTGRTKVRNVSSRPGRSV
jgi:hypothetical protein